MESEAQGGEVSWPRGREGLGHFQFPEWLLLTIWFSSNEEMRKQSYSNCGDILHFSMGKKKCDFYNPHEKHNGVFLCPLEELWTAASPQNVTAVSHNADSVTSVVA